MSIVIEDAVKKYGRGESEIYALNHVSLQIESGEVCVILGPSGSGKSTLLHMIGGLDQLDSGSVTVDGTKITELGKKALTEYRREKAGVVFQSYNLIAELNVKENIRVVADISKDPLDLDTLITELGLSRHATHFPAELSSGQQEMRHRQGARQKPGYFTV
ncbi:MAG: ATP-binding cassette domain-containing protein [Lachnospiraceae bacterium]